MKALTARQPHAELLVSGPKDIENRSRKTNLRGRLLIHAGLEADKDALQRFPVLCTYGAIVGWVEIIDCVENHQSEWAEKDMWHWVIGERKKFAKAIPCKGKLGIWNVPEDIADQLEL